MEQRSCARATCRLPVVGRCSNHQYEFHGVTRDACVGGAFLLDAPQWHAGSRVTLRFSLPGDQHRSEGLHVQGAIVRTTSSGAAVQFDKLSEKIEPRLHDIVWPRWDRENLLEGLVLMSRLEQPVNLTGWLQLTSALALSRK